MTPDAPKPNKVSRTAQGLPEWQRLRAEGRSYGYIAREWRLDETTVREALQKPPSVAAINRIVAELEQAAIVAAKHNVASAVSEKCRLRAAYAKKLGIDSETSTPNVGLDSSSLTKDYLAVDKAILEHLESYAKRYRDNNVEERAGEIHSLDVRRGKILLKMTEAEIDGNSRTDGESAPDGDETLPSNNRAY